MTALAQELGPYLDNPQVRQYLSMITQAEGTAKGADPYRVAFGGKSFDSLDAHPNISTEFTQTDGKKNYSTAAGAYQFLKKTWDGASGALGLTDFGQRSQDLAAVYLLKQNGSLEDVAKGNYKAAIAKDGKTWASLPSSTYAQNKRSMEFVDKALGQSGGLISSANAAPGDSSGDLNAVPASHLLRALEKARAAGDTDAANEIVGALGPKLQKGYAQAQEHNDTDAIAQFETMLGDIGSPVIRKAKPQPTQTPKAAPVAPASASKAPVQNTPAQPDTPWYAKAGKVADDFVRGAADTLTFGYADELAAKANELIGKGKFKDNVAAERKRDSEGGVSRMVGQLAGGLMPAGVAVKAASGAGKLARAGAGAATGAVQGGLYGTGTAEGDLNDRLVEGAKGAAVGGLAGGALSAVMPLTKGQKADRFISKAGGDAAAKLDAEIIGDLGKVAANETQRGVPLTANQLNAVESRYINDVSSSLKKLGKDSGIDVASLKEAIQNRRVLTADELDALRTNPAGAAVADAITKAQRLRSLTAPEQSSGGLGKIARGIEAALPLPQPVHYALRNLLGGRQSREQVAAKVMKDADTAGNVLERLGASEASKSTSALSQLAKDAVAARAARVEAGKANRAVKAKDVSQTPLGKTVAKASADFEKEAGEAFASRLAPEIDPTNLAASATRIVPKVGDKAAISKTINKVAVESEGALSDAALAHQTDVASLASLGTPRAGALTEGKGILAQVDKARGAADELEAASMDGATALKNETFNILQLGKTNKAAAQVEAKVSKATAKAEAKAAAAADVQAGVDRIAAGDFKGLSLKNGPIQGWLNHTDAAPEEIHKTLSRIAGEDPEMGRRVLNALTPGGKLSKTDYYAVQNALHATHGQRAQEAAEGALSSVMDSAGSVVRNPIAYKAATERRQAAVSHAVANSSPEMGALAHAMGALSSPEVKQALFDGAMKKASDADKAVLTKFIEPLIHYGKK